MMMNARLAAIALAVAFSIALPGVAWADETVAIDEPVGVLQTEVVTVDGSAGVLQSGGFFEQRSVADGPRGISAMSAGDYSEFCQLMINAAESWDGTQDSQSIPVLKFGMTQDQVSQAYAQFINEHGQYFYVRSKWEISLRNNVVASVTMLFDTAYSPSSKEVFENAVNAALAGVQNGWNDEQKALYLHDYLVTHCEYDKTYSKYNAYEALVTGSAVCQGYTLAYDYLLKSAGVDDTIISSDDMDHAWNLVTVGGKTYYVDCTWDDPSNVLNEAYCAHEYFLLGKSSFVNAGSSKHDSTDWLDATGADAYSNTSYGASQTYDSAYWADSTSAIPSVGSLWAYAKSSADGRTAAVKAHDYSNGSDVTLVDGLDALWPVSGKPNSYYVGIYTSLASNGEVFIASTPTELYTIDAKAKSKTSLHQLSDSELSKGFIYGIFYDRAAEECVYHLSTSNLEEETGQGTCSLKAASIDSAGYTAGGNTESGGTTPPSTDPGTEGDGNTGETDEGTKPEDSTPTPTDSGVTGEEAGGGTGNTGSGDSAGNTSGTDVSNPGPSSPSNPPAPVPLVVSGGVYMVSGSTYQVTSMSAKTVTLNVGKNAKSVTVPASVKLADGNAYQVTKIKAKAFAKSKATTVTLKTTKLAKKSAVKNAFKNSKVKTVKIKVGKASANKKAVKSYKKILVKSTVGKKVTVK